MKRLSTIMMCLFAMIATSLSAKAQEVTITLYPGWTWISYPKAEVLDINTALGDFVPMEGDVIKSQFSNSTYIRGNWRGGVTHFMPGWGYMYYSNRTEVVSFVFASPTPQSQVQVTTSEPMLITAISAMGGGEVNTTDGTYIIVKGLCWATHENPTTNDDFYQEAESGVGTFSVSMTGLNMSTTYYVRAYAVTPNGTVYGDQKTFTTMCVDLTVNVTNIFVDGPDAWIDASVSGDNGGLDYIGGGVVYGFSPQNMCYSQETYSYDFDYYFGIVIHNLDPNSTCYMKAYVETVIGTFYSGLCIFTTSFTYDGVDLGLPSGNIWATCNVGASSPEEYGDYFAWGETWTKNTYDWSTYQYCNGTSNTLTKYCNNSNYGYNGFTDNLTTLQLVDDVAHATGSGWYIDWRIPTYNEWNELYQYTTQTMTTRNGVNGLLFTANNGNSIFLPAAGYRSGSSLNNAGNAGNYWSSSINTYTPYSAWRFNFNLEGNHIYSIHRYYGFSVRPVGHHVYKK